MRTIDIPAAVYNKTWHHVHVIISTVAPDIPIITRKNTDIHTTDIKQTCALLFPASMGISFINCPYYWLSPILTYGDCAVFLTSEQLEEYEYYIEFVWQTKIQKD